MPAKKKTTKKSNSAPKVAKKDNIVESADTGTLDKSSKTAGELVNTVSEAPISDNDDKVLDTPINDNNDRDKEEEEYAPEVPNMVEEKEEDNILDSGEEGKLGILTAYQISIQDFYSTARRRVVPKRPKTIAELSRDLGLKDSSEILEDWSQAMLKRYRPARGYAPPPISTPEQILKKLK